MDFTNLPIHYRILVIAAFIVFNIPFFKKILTTSRNKKVRKMSYEELLYMDTLRNEVRKDINLTLLKTYLDRLMKGKLELIPLYGYMLNKGEMAKTTYNYMFGFNPGSDGFILIKIDPQGSPASELLRLDSSNITSLKCMSDGSLQINCPQLNGGTLTVIIPGFTSDVHESLYMFKVNQVVIATAFMKYLKQTFTF